MSKLETNTIDTVSGTSTLQVGSTNTSTIALKSGATLTNFPDNTPAFEAFLSSDTTISDATSTKIQFNSEVFDTNNVYDNSTNYRFTPTVAGKYYCYSQTRLSAGGASRLENFQYQFFKNGNAYRTSGEPPFWRFNDNPIQNFSPFIANTIDLDANDYVEVFINIDISTGSPVLVRYATTFGAYKILT